MYPSLVPTNKKKDSYCTCFDGDGKVYWIETWVLKDKRKGFQSYVPTQIIGIGRKKKIGSIPTDPHPGSTTERDVCHQARNIIIMRQVHTVVRVSALYVPNYA